jgi:hypothetical protein
VSEPTARDRAIDRARKLLAQAEHPNTTTEERQAFAARAAEIMLRHDLAEAVVRASSPTQTAAEPIELWRYIIPGSGGHGRHRAWGLGDVAEAYGCAVCFFDNDSGNAPRTMHVIGTASDLDALRMLLPMVAALAETAAAQATGQHRGRLRQEAWCTDSELRREMTIYRRSFLRSFGSGVARQIGQRRHTVVAELAVSGTGAELVLADRTALATAELNRRYPKRGKASRIQSHSRAGARDGFRAGQATDLGTNSLDGGAAKQLPGASTLSP